MLARLLERALAVYLWTSYYDMIITNIIVQSDRQESLAEYSYAADLAGLEYSLTNTVYGAEVLSLNKKRLAIGSNSSNVYIVYISHR